MKHKVLAKSSLNSIPLLREIFARGYGEVKRGTWRQISDDGGLPLFIHRSSFVVTSENDLLRDIV